MYTLYRILILASFFRSVESLTIGKLKGANINYASELLNNLVGKSCVPNLHKLAFSNQMNSDAPSELIHDDNLICNTFVTFIKCFPSLRFIGPGERWSKKFSSVDLLKILSHLKQSNLDVVINYKRVNHSSITNIFFDLHSSNPWQYKYVIDKGRVPKSQIHSSESEGINLLQDQIEKHPVVSSQISKEENENNRIDHYEWTWGQDGKLSVYKVVDEPTEEKQLEYNHNESSFSNYLESCKNLDSSQNTHEILSTSVQPVIDSSSIADNASLNLAEDYHSSSNCWDGERYTNEMLRYPTLEDQTHETEEHDALNNHTKYHHPTSPLLQDKLIDVLKENLSLEKLNINEELKYPTLLSSDNGVDSTLSQEHSFISRNEIVENKNNTKNVIGDKHYPRENINNEIKHHTKMIFFVFGP